MKTSINFFDKLKLQDESLKDVKGGTDESSVDLSVIDLDGDGVISEAEKARHDIAMNSIRNMK